MARIDEGTCHIRGYCRSCCVTRCSDFFSLFCSTSSVFCGNCCVRKGGWGDGAQQAPHKRHHLPLSCVAQGSIHTKEILLTYFKNFSYVSLRYTCWSISWFGITRTFSFPTQSLVSLRGYLFQLHAHRITRTCGKLFTDNAITFNLRSVL